MKDGKTVRCILGEKQTFFSQIPYSVFEEDDMILSHKLTPALKLLMIIFLLFLLF